MGNTNEIFNKEFADKYINQHYRYLSAKFRTISSHINKEGINSLDILDDTCISLYYIRECESYQEFEVIANKKFKICTMEINKEKCRKRRDEDEDG